jgi:phage FluMu protein Com
MIEDHTEAGKRSVSRPLIRAAGIEQYQRAGAGAPSMSKGHWKIMNMIDTRCPHCRSPNQIFSAGLVEDTTVLCSSCKGMIGTWQSIAVSSRRRKVGRVPRARPRP